MTIRKIKFPSNQIAKVAGLDIKLVRKVIDAMRLFLIKEAKAGDFSASLRAFVTFKCVRVAPRISRNPKKPNESFMSKGCRKIRMKSLLNIE